jgi:hypothetical protein
MSELRCPYCNHNFSEPYEYFNNPGNDEAEIECECGETFVATQYVSVDYYAEKRPK